MKTTLKHFLLLVLTAILLTSCSHTDAGDPTINIVPSAIVETSPSVLPKAPIREKIPILISIPELHVEATVQSVGLDEEGRMATIPSAEAIGWYKYGSIPGRGGNSILAGHRDWKGKSGSFRNIEKLNIGDKAEITFDDGSIEAFTVISNNTYPLDAVPSIVMDLSGEERTTLITCTGHFDKKKRGYQSRAVVVLKGEHE